MPSTVVDDGDISGSRIRSRKLESAILDKEGGAMEDQYDAVSRDYGTEYSGKIVVKSEDVNDGNNNLRLFKSTKDSVGKFNFFSSKSRRHSKSSATEAIHTASLRQVHSSVDLISYAETNSSRRIVTSASDLEAAARAQIVPNLVQVTMADADVPVPDEPKGRRSRKGLYLDIRASLMDNPVTNGRFRKHSSKSNRAVERSSSNSPNFNEGGFKSLSAVNELKTPSRNGLPVLLTPPKTAPPNVPAPAFDRDAKGSISSTSSSGSTKNTSGGLFSRRKKKDKSKQNEDKVCASELGAVVSLPLATVVSASGESGSILLPEPGSLAASPVTDLSDSSDSEGDVGPVVVSPGGALGADDDLIEIPICPVSHQVGRMVVDSIIPTDVDNLFTMLFTKSKFFQDLHASRKTFDILQSDWHKSPDGSQNVRQVSFTVTLNHVMGPKHSQVTETQVMLPVSKPGVMYAIDTESVNAGIPYADSFYVTTHFCLTRHSASDTKLCIINQIKYRKSVFSLTKGFIEKNTWAGLEEFYTSLERALKEECTKVNASITAPPTPASGRSGPTRRPNGRKKYPAPSIPSCPSPLIRPPVSALSKDVSVNGSGRALMGASTHSSGSQTHAESSLVLKIILGILTCLLLLNAFLYVKLTRFESAKSQLLYSAPSVAFPKNIPQSNQEWVTLLQQQEELHRLELQKWHEMLISALKTLHQAEEDLESLKFHITSYNTGRQNLNALKEAVDELHQSSLKHNNVLYQSQGSDEKEGFTKFDGGSSTNEQSGLGPTGSDYLNGDNSGEPSLSRQKSFGNEL